VARGGALLCALRLVMEWRFFVEAKSFVLSVREGEPVVRLEERRKGFAGSVILGVQCTGWLVSMVEVVLRNPGVEEFVKSYREGLKMLLVRRGGNRADRFLELRVHAEGGRKGLILLPEGREGRGWSRVAGELSKALAFLDSMALVQCSVIPSPGGEEGWDWGTVVCGGVASGGQLSSR
jgi:hypothetical protein